MTPTTTPLRGVIHGRTIELDDAVDLPDGQEVSVTVTPVVTEGLAPGEGIRLSAGACADEAEELEELLRETYELRRMERGTPLE